MRNYTDKMGQFIQLMDSQAKDNVPLDHAQMDILQQIGVFIQDNS